MVSADIEHDHISIRQGSMDKDILEMNQEERAVYYAACAREAREYLFSIKMPLVYRKGDQTIIEHPTDSINSL